MDRALYLAMSGAREAQIRQSVTTHNLANASTVGFKSILAGAEHTPLAGPGYAAARAYAVTAGQGADVAAGPLLATGRDLDVAVEGDGWVAVLAADGAEAYTRAGDLHVNPFGQLMTADGHPVLGEGGSIAVPPFESIELAADGTISIRPLGQDAAGIAVVDRIRLVDPPVTELVRGDDGLMRLADGGAAIPDAGVRLVSGMLEGSNVNVVTAMVEMIEQARSFELHVKMMSAVEDNDRASSELMSLR